jgi:naphthoate synthase/2-ketocyclohexanecarboxyl-CoA hydrolase
MDGYADLGVISSQFYPDWFDMPEGKEGPAAFAEKRRPEFWRLRDEEHRTRRAFAESYEKRKKKTD